MRWEESEEGCGDVCGETIAGHSEGMGHQFPPWKEEEEGGGSLEG
jgi:hypothetical protein